MENSLSRRNFLYILPSVILGGCFGYRKELDYSSWDKYLNSSNVIRRYEVPSTITPINIEKIVNALEENICLKDADYLDEFVNLVQTTHKQFTGMTNSEHLKKRSGKDNPIKIFVIQDLGYPGRFVHDFRPGQHHKAIFDSELWPTYFLETLNHEFVHGVYSQGEVMARGHTHRDISFMIAQHPQLLRERDGVCPLYFLIDFYATIFRDTKSIGGYLEFLTSSTADRNSQTHLDLNDLVLKLINMPSDIDEELFKEFFNKFKSDGIEYLKLIISNFLQNTENYILENNPIFPQDKKRLLNSKIGRILQDKFQR